MYDDDEVQEWVKRVADAPEASGLLKQKLEAALGGAGLMLFTAADLIRARGMGIRLG